MALGSWTALYNHVTLKFMEQEREPELLLLMLIAGHADAFGFCFPARKDLLRIRRISKETYDAKIAYLIKHKHIVIYENYDYRRRQAKFDFMVSPRTMYVRSEIQDYCEAIFDGIQERDYIGEKNFLGNLSSTKDSLESTLGNLSSTKDSQPESYPESETRIRNQNQKPAAGIQIHNQHHNQLSALTESDQGASPQARVSPYESTPRTGPQRIAQPQPTAVQNRNESAGLDCDEFHTLLSDDVDDERIAREIEHVVSTSPTQAAQAVQDYPRELIVHWLRITAKRRAAGTLSKPGGWFFAMLKKHNPLIVLEEGNPDSVISAYTGKAI